MVMRRGNGNNQMEKEPKKTLNRDGFAKEMQEVWRSRFGFDDEEFRVYIGELKWLVAMSGGAVPSAVLKAKEMPKWLDLFQSLWFSIRHQTQIVESTSR
jgi:hypothetical protein